MNSTNWPCMCGEQSNITLDDAQACVGDASDAPISTLVNATFSGQVSEVERLLVRLTEEGIPPVTILRAHIRYAIQLRELELHQHHGSSTDEAMKKMRIFFKQIPVTRQHMATWKKAKLKKADALLLSGEIESKSGIIAPPHR